MPQPLPQGVPPGFWADYLKRFEEDIARLKSELARLENGDMRVGKRELSGPWIDITPEVIASDRHAITEYEAILAALSRNELP